MKIVFNEITEGKSIRITKEFIIDQSLNLRMNEENGKLIIKLRNSDYETQGRKLKIDGLEKINQLVIEEETYSNLKYLSHELYIHMPKGELKEGVLCEDVTVTFEKEVV